MTAGEPAVIVSLGVHIVDILGRPVTGIPPGQGRQLLDEIRITAAGTAAGTSVDLAKLGAQRRRHGRGGRRPARRFPDVSTAEVRH